MSTTESAPERPPEPCEPSRKRLAIETICSDRLVAAITSTIQTLIWDHKERLDGTLEKYNWSPINDLSLILLFMPFGFILYSLLPIGWLFWAGFGSTLWNRSRAFIIVAVAGSIIFGVFWPKHFVAMMGI